MPVGLILVGFRQGEHASFPEDTAREGEAGRVAFFVEAVRNDDAGLAGQVRNRGMEGRDGFGV